MTTEMLRLSEANPVTDEDQQRWVSGAEAADIIASVLASAPVEQTGDAAPSARGPRAWVAAVLVVLTVAAALVVLPGRDRGTDAAAAAVLNEVADVAAGGAPPAVGPGEFVYTRSKDTYMATTVLADNQHVTALVSHDREIWIGSDGSGRLRVRSGKPFFLGERDRQNWEEAGRPELGESGVSDQTFGPGGLSATDFSSYPREADDLYERIRHDAQGAGDSLDSEMLVLVGDLLRETAAPPELRAALFRVAARIPGVELIGDVEDPVGREGIAVGRESDDGGYLERIELIFDPDTSELLAERQLLLEEVDWVDAEPGTVIGWAVYLDNGVTNSVDEKP